MKTKQNQGKTHKQQTSKKRQEKLAKTQQKRPSTETSRLYSYFGPGGTCKTVFFQTLCTVCSFQYSGVFAAFLLVFLGVFCLFAACVFFIGFAWFSLFLLFFIFFLFSYVPSEQPVYPPETLLKKKR